MEDLIKALQIFLKYGNPKHPTWTCHDELHIVIDSNLVSDEDIRKLDELGFNEDDHDGFYSFRFGSC